MARTNTNTQNNTKTRIHVTPIIIYNFLNDLPVQRLLKPLDIGHMCFNYNTNRVPKIDITD